MIPHKVVLEIEVDAENPLAAAKYIQNLLDAASCKWQFYVQPCDKSEDVFSVDLAEDDSNAVYETDSYIPLIK